MSHTSASEVLVNLPGGKVFVKTWMPSIQNHQSPLILLHDSLGCVDTWREYPKILAEKLKRTVIAYDRLGFGKSDARDKLPSIDFIREEAEIYFPALQKQLGIQGFSVFGHSVGGGMALEIAAINPNCFAVVSESTQAFVEDRTVDGISKSKLAFENPERLEKLKKYHGEKAAWVVEAWTNIWLSPEFANWSLQSTLPKVKCPVLAIHGDKDEYGSVKFPEMICRLAGGTCELKVMTGYGHVPHKENETEISQLILNFLKNIP